MAGARVAERGVVVGGRLVNHSALELPSCRCPHDVRLSGRWMCIRTACYPALWSSTVDWELGTSFVLTVAIARGLGPRRAWSLSCTALGSERER
jgi:hypothetical protein